MSYQIASLFDMNIDMGERIAGKQDRFSLIIEDPPQGPQNIHFFFTFWPINEKMVFKLFPLVVHNYVSTVMRSTFADILVLLVPLDFM